MLQSPQNQSEQDVILYKRARKIAKAKAREIRATQNQHSMVDIDSHEEIPASNPDNQSEPVRRSEISSDRNLSDDFIADKNLSDKVTSDEAPTPLSGK